MCRGVEARAPFRGSRPGTLGHTHARTRPRTRTPAHARRPPRAQARGGLPGSSRGSLAGYGAPLQAKTAMPGDAGRARGREAAEATCAASRFVCAAQDDGGRPPRRALSTKRFRGQGLQVVFLEEEEEEEEEEEDTFLPVRQFVAEQ